MTAQQCKWSDLVCLIRPRRGRLSRIIGNTVTYGQSAERVILTRSPKTCICKFCAEISPSIQAAAATHQVMQQGTHVHNTDAESYCTRVA
jgi:hypothetical protein